MQGLRNAILTATKGTAVLNTNFLEYAPWAGDLSMREFGSLTAFETGQSSTYALTRFVMAHQKQRTHATRLLTRMSVTQLMNAAVPWTQFPAAARTSTCCLQVHMMAR